MHAQMRYASLLAACTLAVPAAAEADLFQGTLVREGAQWVLVRCNAVKTRYRLDLPASEAGRFDAAWQAGAGVVQASLLASAEAEGGGYRLNVESVRALAPGSCHLEDLL
ncbi:hypothetical protein [Crenobacter caeni]|uniref:Lysozyme inhibitor n=1 Tax=Crenobacter caeni TaxID=2705474 RepID=A0A6B2KU81_9NEIS|nr:hypothetical protein [Crenobacter caeni]NDV13701.1 hypothetical protein [Crenobacter caeni]